MNHDPDKTSRHETIYPVYVFGFLPSSERNSRRILPKYSFMPPQTHCYNFTIIIGLYNYVLLSILKSWTNPTDPIEHSGPVYTIPDCVGAERFSYRIRLLFTLRHSNPERDAEQKSLRFGGDMKSKPVCVGICFE